MRPRRVLDDGQRVTAAAEPAPAAATVRATQMLPIEPGWFDLAVYRGDTYEWVFKMLGQSPAADGGWETSGPIDIHGWRFKAEIRNSIDGPLLASLQRMPSIDPTLVIGTEEANTVIREELREGMVRFRLTADQSRLIDRNGVWDLESTSPDGWVKTILRGNVNYMGDVTTGLIGRRDYG